MDKVTEIRWHGRGGQGAVTAGELLAETALHEGKFFQAFPDYGPERMGAPIRAYTRISPRPIRQHSQITNPDLVVLLDPTLIGVVDITEGLKEEGALVVNTGESPEELRRTLKYDKGTVYTVDATRIALDTIGRNFPNTPMLGAVLRAREVVDRGSLLKELRRRFSTRGIGKKVIEANVAAVERAFSEAKQG